MIERGLKNISERKNGDENLIEIEKIGRNLKNRGEDDEEMGEENGLGKCKIEEGKKRIKGNERKWIKKIKNIWIEGKRKKWGKSLEEKKEKMKGNIIEEESRKNFRDRF